MRIHAKGRQDQSSGHMMTARALDHLVLPVHDLATARARLGRLGFTVAADARHPFGTENACVYFSDRTYLEPLAIGEQSDYEASVRGGNQFTARDAAFRFRNGTEGFSGIGMVSEDADADHEAFRHAGFSAGEQLQFSRLMRLPDGSEFAPRFKLAFATDLRSPDFFGFTCQRVPQVDRSALESHANGAIGIKSVVLSEQAPADFIDFLKLLTGQEAVEGDDDALLVRTANADLVVLDAAELRLLFGLHMAPERGLRGEAVVFRVSDLSRTEAVLVQAGIQPLKSHGMLLVPHEPGQGILFAFSE
jgi:hypothetical protein